jgi:hypothetical protein
MVEITYSSGSISQIQNNTQMIPAERNGARQEIRADLLQVGDKICFCTDLDYATIDGITVT